MTDQPYILFAPLLNPLSDEAADWHPSGALVVDEHGRILFSGNASELPERFHGLPELRRPDIIMPGFIDLHTHLPQYDCRGKFGKSLIEWLNSFVYPEEARLADESVARDMAQRFFRDLIKSGTTTAMVLGPSFKHATNIAFEEAERSGLRIILGKMQMDRLAPGSLCEDTAQSLLDTELLIRKWHRKTPLLSYAVTPRFALSCTPDLLKHCGRIAARFGTHIQTHLNESRAEIAAIMALFPEYQTYTHILEAMGLLTERTILAHNVHPTVEELSLCEAYGCAVAHCPDSNLFLGSGRFPLEQYRSTTIPFGLGSDVGAGTTLSMFHMMRCMTYVQGSSLHPFIPLYHATLGGAKALSIADQTGNFSPGKQADFIAVRIDPSFFGGMELAQLSPLAIASVIVYRSQAQDVSAAWVNGRLLMA
jgi:guanine deaminase